jgi:hypothetical protein
MVPGPAVPAAAFAAAAVAAIGVLVGVTSGRPPGDSRTQLTALVFTTTHGYVDVVIRNPYADPAQYRAEFAAHHPADGARIAKRRRHPGV